MPSPPILDFDTLIAPIPGDDPAGSSVPFAVTQQLEEMRKEIDPDSFSKNDPTRPEAKKADWKGTIELTQETLRNTSKDLLIAARLTEALVKVHGFAGLRDGLHLFRLLAEQGWDRLLPAIEEEDDLEVRAARFNWLDDKDRGARFPGTLRLVPLMDLDGQRYGWQHWKDSQGAKSKITGADVERAIQVTPLEKSELVFEDMEESWKELAGLGQVLSQKMATPSKNYAPGLVGIREAIGDCRTLAQQILQKKGGGKKVALQSAAQEPDSGQAPSTRGEPRHGDPGRDLRESGRGGREAPADRAAQPDPLPAEPCGRARIPAVSGPDEIADPQCRRAQGDEPRAGDQGPAREKMKFPDTKRNLLP